MTSFVGEKGYLGNKIIYGKVQINGEELTIGDLVYCNLKKKSRTTRSGNSLYSKICFIGQVLYFYETGETKIKCVHLKNLVPKTKIFRTKDDDAKRKKAKNFGIELFDSLSVCQNLEVSGIVSVTVTILELIETFPYVHMHIRLNEIFV